jgi:multiple sugar transport system permease protein
MFRFFNSMRDGVGFDLILVGAALVFLVALAGLPLVYNVLMSFQQVDMFTLGTLIRPWAGFDNYVAVVREPAFWLVTRNTLIFVFASMAGQFVIGFGLALFFAQNFPGAATIRGSCPGSCPGWLWARSGAGSWPATSACSMRSSRHLA